MLSLYTLIHPLIQNQIEAATKIIRKEQAKMWKNVAAKLYTERRKAYHPDDVKAKFTGQVG
jgi:ribosomal protein L18E